MTTVGRYSPNKVRGRVLDGSWPEPIGGMALIKPTSVSATGTGSGASIGTNGSVTFSTCETLSLNGVFSADYDNYLVTIRHLANVPGTVLNGRLRSSGTDSSSNYTYQSLEATNTSVSGTRASWTSAYIGEASSSQRSGTLLNVYAPFLAQPTAFRNTSASGRDNAGIADYACTHSESTSYDGFTIFVGSTVTLTGLVSVYGLVGA